MVTFVPHHNETESIESVVDLPMSSCENRSASTDRISRLDPVMERAVRCRRLVREIDSGVCVNNVDPLLPDRVAEDLSTWEIKKPVPTSRKAIDAANALALRGAIEALGTTTVRGRKPRVIGDSGVPP